jgi:hypothetical protein
LCAPLLEKFGQLLGYLITDRFEFSLIFSAYDGKIGFVVTFRWMLLVPLYGFPQQLTRHHLAHMRVNTWPRKAKLVGQLSDRHWLPRDQIQNLFFCTIGKELVLRYTRPRIAVAAACGNALAREEQKIVVSQDHRVPLD